MSVAFVDANVFVYALLRTPRKLEPHEVKSKQAAKSLLGRINEGERVACSVVHFSELCNILEYYMSFEGALELEKGLLLRRNIQICEVTQEDYLNAAATAELHHVGLNDALAYVLMKREGITKIYSFDKHFDCFSDIERRTE